MHEIPHAVLSERFAELMRDRRLKTAAFLTFRFEPDFFEQEVLPTLLDLPLSQASTVRLLQLEDALKSHADNVAVYYDRAGLMAGAQSAKLDIRRIPVTFATGYFHPKNVLLLTEASEPDDNGHRDRQLVVATMSANLTRAGWWENIEVCHIERVGEREPCAFRKDLLDLIRRVKSACPAEDSHEALDSIRGFVQNLSQRRRSTTDGVFHPRLYSGGQSVTDFLDGLRGARLRELCLEVISPYFDKTDAGPLEQLCERFVPREVRVFLPRADDGSALCADACYQAVRKMHGTHWAQLPPDLLRIGKNEQLKRRTVHAKVYRFFHPRKCYEAFLVGSVNLTTAAHSKWGNLETAFLLETRPNRVPTWWLQLDTKKPTQFVGSETEEASSVTTALTLRFSWAQERAEAFWDATVPPGLLTVSAQGAPLFTLPSFPVRHWRRLSEDSAAALKNILTSTSFVAVSEDGGPTATILVQEEDMAHKPSLLFTLTAADILRYWALLTPEQRTAFLDERVGAIPQALRELGIDPPPLPSTRDSIFDTFAGIYHAFHALEQFVLDALKAGRQKEAEYRLLGKKYDSLPNLIDRVRSETGSDPVSRYVMLLCAKQLVQYVAQVAPAFRKRHRKAFKNLTTRLADADNIRAHFHFGSPEERAAFLQWFDEWFLANARTVKATT